MSCPICSGRLSACFKAKVLHKYEAQYEVCDGCGFLRARDPHWLAEAYAEAIAMADTGLVMRNGLLACKLAGVLYWVAGERGAGRYLDAAGGYGMLTRLMRDFGFDFYWADKYSSNLMARGYEYVKDLGQCQAVTAMEVIEHLTDPAKFVEETLAAAGSDTLVFSTQLYEGAVPDPHAWWYYAFATGQHIGFFQRRSLEALGRRLGLGFSSANGIHILSRKLVNERILGIVTNRWVCLASPWWTRRKLGSKTMDDQTSMLKALE